MVKRSDTDPLPNPAEKNKHWKRVGKNTWREISDDEALTRHIKGFNIKRDKGGKGFSMMIHKKIKGFEEGTDMSKQEINELGPGTLKSYQKKAVRDLGRRAYSAGLKGGAEKPEAKQDVQRAEKHEKYIKKASERLAGYYRPKHVRQRNPRYGGVRKYSGEYSSHKFYQPSGEDVTKAAEKGKDYSGKSYTPQSQVPWSYKDMGDRKRWPRKMGRLGPYRANEETEMTKKEQLDELKKSTLRSYTKGAAPDIWDAGVDLGAARERGNKSGVERYGRKVQKRTEGIQKAMDRLGGKYHTKVQSRQNIKAKYPAYDTHRYRAEETELEGGEQTVLEPNISDLVVHALDQKPLEFQQTFADLMQQRVEDAVHGAKLDVAASFIDPEANTEFDDDNDDVEPGDNDSDWNGTEYEGEEEWEDEGGAAVEEPEEK